MNLGFRKAMFGFHRDDVIRYIETAQETFCRETDELRARVESLEAELAARTRECADAVAERDRLQAELGELNTRQESLQKLSEGIGRLYLVAQSNAQALCQNAQEQASLSDTAVGRNLDALQDADHSLTELRAQLNDSTQRFSQEIDALQTALRETRTQLEAKRAATDDAAQTLSDLMQKVTAE